MAHPCIQCGSECYCHGDIDDVIVSQTPKRCEGCGCIEMFFDDEDTSNDEDFTPCDDCDLPDACADFGCARAQGLRRRAGDI